MKRNRKMFLCVVLGIFALGAGCSEPEKRPKRDAKRSTKAPAELPGWSGSGEEGWTSSDKAGWTGPSKPRAAASKGNCQCQRMVRCINNNELKKKPKGALINGPNTVACLNKYCGGKNYATYQNACKANQPPAKRSAVKRCKDECREGYEKYMKKNPELASSWSKTLRDCKSSCEKDPNF